MSIFFDQSDKMFQENEKLLKKVASIRCWFFGVMVMMDGK